MPLVTTHFIKSIALATYQTKSYLCLISAWLLNIYIIFCGCSFDTMLLKLPMNCCSLNMFSHHMIFWPVFNWLNIGFLLLSNLVKKKTWGFTRIYFYILKSILAIFIALASPHIELIFRLLLKITVGRGTWWVLTNFWMPKGRLAYTTVVCLNISRLRISWLWGRTSRLTLENAEYEQKSNLFKNEKQIVKLWADSEKGQ